MWVVTFYEEGDYVQVQNRDGEWINRIGQLVEGGKVRWQGDKEAVAKTTEKIRPARSYRIADNKGESGETLLSAAHETCPKWDGS